MRLQTLVAIILHDYFRQLINNLIAYVIRPFQYLRHIPDIVQLLLRKLYILRYLEVLNLHVNQLVLALISANPYLHSHGIRVAYPRALLRFGLKYLIAPS